MAVETLPAAQPIFDNRSKNLIFANVRYVPNELKRRELKGKWHKKEKVPEKLWTDRGRAVEIYVADVIATQTDIIDHVEIKEGWSEEGPDLIVYFVNGFPIEKIGVEVKSSSMELSEGKKKIRNKSIRSLNSKSNTKIDIKMLSQWQEQPDSEKEIIISALLTDKGIILINGGEKDKKEKTPEEILWDSFYEQLTRRVEKIVGKPLNAPKDQLMLFPGLALLWLSKYGNEIPIPKPVVPGQLDFGWKNESIQIFPNPDGQLDLQLAA